MITFDPLWDTLKINKDWLVKGTGDMGISKDISQNAKISAEIYEVAKKIHLLFIGLSRHNKQEVTESPPLPHFSVSGRGWRIS